jgi:hypothetical protein
LEKCLHWNCIGWLSLYESLVSPWRFFRLLAIIRQLSKNRIKESQKCACLWQYLTPCPDAESDYCSKFKILEFISHHRDIEMAIWLPLPRQSFNDNFLDLNGPANIVNDNISHSHEPLWNHLIWVQSSGEFMNGMLIFFQNVMKCHWTNPLLSGFVEI